MNKRKPDDEFALINLSYFTVSGEEIVVFCPESKDTLATQQPARRALKQNEAESATVSATAQLNAGKSASLAAPAGARPSGTETILLPPQEQHFTILYGDTGHSYESIMMPYKRARIAAVGPDDGTGAGT